MRKLVVVLFALCMIAPLWGQTEMPAYVLFRMIDAGDPSDQLSFQSGWPIQVSDQNLYVGKQVLPKFGQVVITDATVGDISTIYMLSWDRFLDWTVDNHDVVNDIYSVHAFIDPSLVSATGLNSLTKVQVENFLTRWNAASIDDISQNSVGFTVSVADALQSEGFWKNPVDFIVFDEKDYDSVTGIHTLEADYSLTQLSQNKVASIVISRCGLDSINVINGNKVNFSCPRNIVMSSFKEEVRMGLDSRFSLRKWRLLPAALQAIINAGGSLEVTKSEVVQGLRYRLDD